MTQSNGSQKVSRSGLGRPAMPIDHARSKRIVTLVTLKESLALTDLCHERKQSMSEMCHHILSEYLSKIQKTRPNT